MYGLLRVHFESEGACQVYAHFTSPRCHGEELSLHFGSRAKAATSCIGNSEPLTRLQFAVREGE